jgi:acetolactate synthase-1/2/3 large subunit
VGWGIGGAMAARLAFPDRPIILLSGDGAFTFTVADLESAARQSLPFVAIVADDQGWGITRIGHIEKYGEAMASSLGPIAFDRLAESLGARGMRVERKEEIQPALESALKEPRVTVIQVPVVGGNPGA